jgi:hypothetical protein
VKRSDGPDRVVAPDLTRPGESHRDAKKYVENQRDKRRIQTRSLNTTELARRPNSAHGRSNLIPAPPDAELSQAEELRLLVAPPEGPHDPTGGRNIVVVDLEMAKYERIAANLIREATCQNRVLSLCANSATCSFGTRPITR